MITSELCKQWELGDNHLLAKAHCLPLTSALWYACVRARAYVRVFRV